MTTFNGEHLSFGIAGQSAVILAFGTSLYALCAFLFSIHSKEESRYWLKAARIAWAVHLVAIGSIIVSLYLIISNHYFEYHYAWEHSSRELPLKYIVSCFWEGQEGSFLLWSFWHVVIGSILIFSAKRWEAPVMATLCLSQCFIVSMLLGVDVAGFQIGSSPFILTRNVILDAPVFKNPDYLKLFLTNGRGLNPLLQNYWMVIHPPMLFFGFASMIVPFGYAAAGLYTRQYTAWIKPALVWALTAVMVLGIAIVMGSAWAYEALSFGGFWQWDPVENASLIPWLILIAAIHVMVSFKSTRRGYFAAVLLVMTSYVLVLYASFLTRSGILQNSSVHAFTDLGMQQQLLLHLLIFFLIMTVLMVRRWKELPVTAHEASIYSREFWMFIGAMVLTISCLQIIATTSIPVWNQLFHTKVAPPVDLVGHYNKWQLLFTVLITLISGFSQLLKYKYTSPAKFVIQLAVFLVVSAVLTALFCWLTSSRQAAAILLIFSCVFAVISNSKLLGMAFDGKIRLAGPAVAHIGFAIMLTGALIAASKKKVISINTSGASYGSDFTAQNNAENIMLVKGEPFAMSPYRLTYLSDSVSGPDTYYRINYRKVDPSSNRTLENFDLYPTGQINDKMGGLIASPATRHYLFKDIYTHLSSVPTREEQEQKSNDTSYVRKVHRVHLGDTVHFSKGIIKIMGINRNPKIKNIEIDTASKDLALGLALRVRSDGVEHSASPIFLIKNTMAYDLPGKVDQLGLKLRFSNIFPADGSFELIVLERKEAERDYIIMKAMIFPFINLLWGGAIIMFTGFLLSIFWRNGDRSV